MDRFRFDKQSMTMMEQSPVPFAVYQFIDERVCTIALSMGFLNVFGYSDRAAAYALMDDDMYRDAHPQDVSRISGEAYRFATQGGEYDVLYRTRRPGSAEYTLIHARGEHFTAAEGVRLAVIWYTDEGVYMPGTDLEAPRNPSPEHLESDILSHDLHYDFLTGLPSMTHFFRLATAGMHRALSQGKQPAMLFIDLCGMKAFNHRYGFSEGDRLIWAVARVLTETFSNENCSRFGQDHFGVYTTHDGLEDKLHGIFEKLKSVNGGRSLPMRVGIYLKTKENLDPDTACDRAKIACDSIRSSYSSAFRYFDGTMQKAVTNRLYVLEHLDEALADKWIQVYYQPIVRTTNGLVCNEEALARWVDPEKGMLFPDEFIPCLEDTMLAYRLDLYMVEQVLADICRKREANIQPVPVSVNLSRSDFEVCDIVEEIRRRVDESGLGRDMLVIEITESVIARNPDFMRQQLDRLKELGFSVWMDDFGSGYSSLDVLQSFDFTLLKFDMYFMRHFESSEKSRIILTELMQMAQHLGVDTVVEGVETAQQLLFLKNIGCDKVQGYYFCKPISMQAVLGRYASGTQIGMEDVRASDYYTTVGTLDLYNPSMANSSLEGGAQTYFDTVPMAVMELSGDKITILRCNSSYREFMHRTFGAPITGENIYDVAMPATMSEAFPDAVKNCRKDGPWLSVEEIMPDGTTTHAFVRYLAENPVSGAKAVSVLVLALSRLDEGGSGAIFQRMVDHLAKPCAILSVKRGPDNTASEVRIVRANQAYKSAEGEGYYDNMPYQELVPRMLKFENSCYRCAFQHQQIHTYIEMKSTNRWTDQQLIPLHSDRDDIGYCQFIIDFTDKPEREHMASVSIHTASSVLRSAITLLGTEDLNERVGKVLEDIMEFSEAFSVRVMLVDHENRRAINYCDRMAIELPEDFVPPEEDPDGAQISYKLICSWEDTIGDQDSLVVTNEKEMSDLYPRNPVWVNTMRAYGVYNLVLIPLRHDKTIIGYLYICNFNPDTVAEIQEFMQLMSFFLGTEIYNEVLLKRLDVMSHTDALTGLNNRNAMIRRTAAITAGDQNQPFGVVNLDLNGLKTVNDLEGHDAGDRLLVRAAETLKKYFYEGDLYRTGGDEFIVIATGITVEAFHRKVDRLREGIAKGDDVSFALGAYWSDGSVDVAQAFRMADEFMYQDKRDYYRKHPGEKRR